MEEIKILEILTKKAEKYNVSFCGVESNAIIEAVNEALSLHIFSQRYTIEDIERCVENWGLCKVEKEYIERFLNGG